MKECAEKEGIMSEQRRMLISSVHLKIGTIFTPLLLYYLHLGFERTKIHQFVQYTPKKYFNSFVQCPVNARREEDENPNSIVVAETMKFLANSSYGYQIKDRSRHFVTKYSNDETFHSAINIKVFQRLNFITDQLNLSSQKMNIESQSLSYSSFCNMQSSECGSFMQISLKSLSIPKF